MTGFSPLLNYVTCVGSTSSVSYSIASLPTLTAKSTVCVHAKPLQSCPILCDPMDSPGSSVHGILQARILEWVAMLSSRDLSYPGIELTPPVAPDLQVDSLRLSHWGSPKVQSPTLHLVNESHSPVGLGLCRAALCCPQMFWISSLCSQLRQPLVPWSAVSIQHGHLCSWTLYASLGRKGDCVGWKRGWDPSVPVSIP